MYYVGSVGISRALKRCSLRNTGDIGTNTVEEISKICTMTRSKEMIIRVYKARGIIANKTISNVCTHYDGTYRYSYEFIFKQGEPFIVIDDYSTPIYYTIKAESQLRNANWIYA